MANEQVPTQLPHDYDEYGNEPQQDEEGGDTQAPKPDEALTDPA